MWKLARISPKGLLKRLEIDYLQCLELLSAADRHMPRMHACMHQQVVSAVQVIRLLLFNVAGITPSPCSDHNIFASDNVRKELAHSLATSCQNQSVYCYTYSTVPKQDESGSIYFKREMTIGIGLYFNEQLSFEREKRRMGDKIVIDRVMSCLQMHLSVSVERCQRHLIYDNEDSRRVSRRRPDTTRLDSELNPKQTPNGQILQLAPELPPLEHLISVFQMRTLSGNPWVQDKWTLKMVRLAILQRNFWGR